MNAEQIIAGITQLAPTEKNEVVRFVISLSTRQEQDVPTDKREAVARFLARWTGAGRQDAPDDAALRTARLARLTAKHVH